MRAMRAMPSYDLGRLCVFEHVNDERARSISDS